MARRGIVAAGDPQTARAGALVLRAGGNAVDAICAAAFASFVCEPLLTSAAGAGVLLHGGPDRPWRLLDFFARVPGLGEPPVELDFHEVKVDFGVTTQAFHVGRGAVAVPGALRGLLHVHGRHGRVPLVDVLAPAIALAHNGYVVSSCLAYTSQLLTPIITLTPSTLDLLSVDGRIARAEDVLTNHGQAHLFEALGRDPAAAVRAVEADLRQAFGPPKGGLLTERDLATFQPVERTPLSVGFADHTVMLNPPPSSGGGLVALGLRLAERTGVTQAAFGEHWNTLSEILRTISQTRTRDYQRRLDEPGYVASLLSDAAVDDAWLRRGRPQPEPMTLGSTTHISVLDDEGGAASMTASNGEGCGYTLSQWGVHANNFLGEEDINPGGFHAQPAGTEMTTMMCPAVVLREGRPVIAIGSGGSNRIRSALLQVLVNRLGFGQPWAQAVAADRMHVEGRRLWFEATEMSAEAEGRLMAEWGQATRFEEQNMFFGGVHAAAYADGDYTGAGDPRRGGVVCRVEDV